MGLECTKRMPGKQKTLQYAVRSVPECVAYDRKCAERNTEISFTRGIACESLFSIMYTRHVWRQWNGRLRKTRVMYAVAVNYVTTQTCVRTFCGRWTNVPVVHHCYERLRSRCRLENGRKLRAQEECAAVRWRPRVACCFKCSRRVYIFEKASRNLKTTAVETRSVTYK